MLAQERQTEIINMLTQRGGIVKMTEIAQRFGVSNETVRRDLEFLQEQHLIQRVYGGAVLVDRQSTSARAIFSASRAKESNSCPVVLTLKRQPRTNSKSAFCNVRFPARFPLVPTLPM